MIQSQLTRDTHAVSHLTDELDVRRRAAEGFGEDVEVEGFSDVPVRRRQISSDHYTRDRAGERFINNDTQTDTALMLTWTDSGRI